MASEQGHLPEKELCAHNKREAILRACHTQDIEALADLANSKGGLLEDELRATSWPILLGCPINAAQSSRYESWQNLPPHRDEQQVEKDVNRAFVHYPKDESQKSIAGRRVALSNLIVGTLRLNPMLHYFQGYHDIVQVFLLVLGEPSAYPVVERTSLLRIRDYMLYTIRPAEQQMQLIGSVLHAADPVLAQHLSRTRAFYALGALLTLYAYLVEDYTVITRLYDFILAHEPAITIYMVVSHIIARRRELLEEDDEDILHHTLQRLPPNTDFQALIDGSLRLYREFPPALLSGRAWRNISQYSVLKTSPALGGDLDQARALFVQQETQLHREDFARKIYSSAARHARKNRGRYALVGTSILAGAFAFWAQRSGFGRAFWPSFWHVMATRDRYV